jgi:hypothetical protein
MHRMRIFKSELSLISDEILRHPRIETGGQLIGLWTHGGAPVVYAATRPGRNSIRQIHHFQQDPDVHRQIEAHMWKSFGLQCIGIWHSHHQLQLTELSQGDLERTQRYARRHNRPKFAEILGWIRNAEAQLRPYVFTDAKRLVSEDAELEVLPGRSPLRSSPVPPGIADALLPEGGEGSWRLHCSTALRPGMAGPEKPPSAAQIGLRRLEGWIERSIPEELRGGIGLETVSEGYILEVSSPSLPKSVHLRLGPGSNPELEAAWMVERGRKKSLSLDGGAEAMLRAALAKKKRRRKK